MKPIQKPILQKIYNMQSVVSRAMWLFGGKEASRGTAIGGTAVGQGSNIKYPKLPDKQEWNAALASLEEVANVSLVYPDLPGRFGPDWPALYKWQEYFWAAHEHQASQRLIMNMQEAGYALFKHFIYLSLRKGQPEEALNGLETLFKKLTAAHYFNNDVFPKLIIGDDIGSVLFLKHHIMLEPGLSPIAGHPLPLPGVFGESLLDRVEASLRFFEELRGTAASRGYQRFNVGSTVYHVKPSKSGGIQVPMFNQGDKCFAFDPPWVRAGEPVEPLVPKERYVQPGLMK